MTPADSESRVAYREAVAEISSVPVAFIEAEKLDGLTPDAARMALREQLRTQLPHLDSLTDGELDSLVADAKPEEGPSAHPYVGKNGVASCIAIEPRRDFNKAAIGAFLTGIPSSRLNLPGHDSDYSAAVGYHEGAHCNQQDILSGSEGSLSQALYQLNKEVGGDRMIDGNASPEVAASMKYLRALSVMSETGGDYNVHATKPFLEGKLGLTNENLQAATAFRDRVMEEVFETIGTCIGIGAQEASSLCATNPDLFRHVTKSLLDQGAFNEDSAQKVFAQDYVEAYDRLVLPESPSSPNGTSPKPHIHGPGCTSFPTFLK